MITYVYCLVCEWIIGYLKMLMALELSQYILIVPFFDTNWKIVYSIG